MKLGTCELEPRQAGFIVALWAVQHPGFVRPAPERAWVLWLQKFEDMPTAEQDHRVAAAKFAYPEYF